MYTVIDYYESPFGEAVYVAKSRKDAEAFCEEYTKQTDGECDLVIAE